MDTDAVKDKAGMLYYDNEFNDFVFMGMNALTLNFIFYTIYRGQKENFKKITITFSEIRESEVISQRDMRYFVERTLKFFDSVFKIYLYKSNKNGSHSFVHIFQTLDVFEKKGKKEAYLEVTFSPAFVKLMKNSLTNEYTALNLSQFISIKQKYTKNLYRLLVQFKSTGRLSISFDKLVTLLDFQNKAQDNKYEITRAITSAARDLSDPNTYNMFENIIFKKSYKPGTKDISSFSFFFKYKEPKELLAISKYVDEKNNKHANVVDLLENEIDSLSPDEMRASLKHFLAITKKMKAEKSQASKRKQEYIQDHKKIKERVSDLESVVFDENTDEDI